MMMAGGRRNVQEELRNCCSTYTVCANVCVCVCADVFKKYNLLARENNAKICTSGVCEDLTDSVLALHWRSSFNAGFVNKCVMI